MDKEIISDEKQHVIDAKVLDSSFFL